MSPGETEQFECDTCAKVFELTLEPDCPSAEDATPEICPFCGGHIVNSGEGGDA